MSSRTISIMRVLAAIRIFWGYSIISCLNKPSAKLHAFELVNERCRMCVIETELVEVGGPWIKDSSRDVVQCTITVDDQNEAYWGDTTRD